MKENSSSREGIQQPPYSFNPSAFPQPRSASEATPAQGEITVPGTAPFTEGVPQGSLEADILLEQFDERRIDWKWGDKNVGHHGTDLGYNPKHIKYIVRRGDVIAYPDNSDAAIAQRMTDFHVANTRSAAEMQRLTAGSDLIITEHRHIVPPYTTENALYDESYNAFIYVQRLTGRRLNTENPEHAPYALQLGRATTKYMADTPPGGRYASEYLYPDQWTVGRPLFNRTRPTGLYLHDIDSMDRLNIRPPLDPNAAIDEDYDDFEDVEAYTDTINSTIRWVGNLTVSAERDELLRTLESLRLPEY